MSHRRNSSVPSAVTKCLLVHKGKHITDYYLVAIGSSHCDGCGSNSYKDHYLRERTIHRDEAKVEIVSHANLGKGLGPPSEFVRRTHRSRSALLHCLCPNRLMNSSDTALMAAMDMKLQKRGEVQDSSTRGRLEEEPAAEDLQQQGQCRGGDGRLLCGDAMGCHLLDMHQSVQY